MSVGFLRVDDLSLFLLDAVAVKTVTRVGRLSPPIVN